MYPTFSLLLHFKPTDYTMKTSNRLIAFVAAALLATSSWAQMTFTYSAAATESTLADGSTLVQLPAGTDLNSGFITAATVGSESVSLSDTLFAY